MGFVRNPRVFLSLIFASIRSACSLEILSIPRTHPSCSPLGIVDPHRSLQIWTDIPAAVFLDHSIEITKTLRCNISKIKWYDWQTGQGKVKEEWKYSLMVTGELYAMTNGAFFFILDVICKMPNYSLPHSLPSPRHTQWCSFSSKFVVEKRLEAAFMEETILKQCLKLNSF